ncbi:hypothetical protein KBZ10_07570 [Streptomyces sp. F63]|uniref:hypothetical protein n=1 Tax=Streptomyces sp. F63 TaxID=2824887 RepID=UPI001B380475|nr:hypothetical protein [Streptomyces sp. F63]MBQ0984380.1 hypothetical protein [Streptomyces sp. F63]
MTATPAGAPSPPLRTLAADDRSRARAVPDDGPVPAAVPAPMALTPTEPLRSARKLPVPAGTEPDIVDPGRLAVTEGTVAVVLEESATVFRIADQKVLQRLNRLDGSCGVKSVRGGAVLVARAACDGRQVVWVHDPATGEREWTWPVPAGLRVEGIPSVSPLVVTLHRDITEGTHSVYHLPGKGEPAVLVDMGRNVDREAGLCEHVTPRCPGAAAGERTLYLQGPSHASPGDSSAQENEVVAFDLRTGKAKWAAMPEAKRELGAGRATRARAQNAQFPVLEGAGPRREDQGQCRRRRQWYLVRGDHRRQGRDQRTQGLLPKGREHPGKGPTAR